MIVIIKQIHLSLVHSLTLFCSLFCFCYVSS